MKRPPKITIFPADEDAAPLACAWLIAADDRVVAGVSRALFADEQLRLLRAFTRALRGEDEE